MERSERAGPPDGLSREKPQRQGASSQPCASGRSRRFLPFFVCQSRAW